MKKTARILASVITACIIVISIVIGLTAPFLHTAKVPFQLQDESIQDHGIVGEQVNNAKASWDDVDSVYYTY
ncbi:MAG: hypothetical protein LBT37_03480 [Lactobacillaceae bacterium]|nr:hypothetical protein [Lactobacillaceae bacterium]